MAALALGLAFGVLGFREGDASAQEIPLAKRVGALKLRASELATRGQYGEAVPLLEEAVNLAKTEPLPPGRELGRDLVAIATALVPTRQYPSLEYLFKRGMEILQASPDAQLGDLMVALNNLSALYDGAGALSARDQTMSYIVNVAANLKQPIDANTVKVFLEVGRIYSNANQYKPVSILYERIHEYVLEHAKDDPKTLATWTWQYAAILARDGQSSKAAELRGEALTLVDRSTATTGSGRMDLLSQMGSIATSKGDLSAAEEALDRATIAAQQAGLDETAEAAAVYHNLAVLYIHQGKTERYPDAEALIRRSIDIETRAGRLSTLSFAQRLNQFAVVLALAGKPQEAELYYRKAIGAFESLTTPAPSEFAQCLKDFSVMLMEQERAAEAAEYLGHAVALVEAKPNEPSLGLANLVSAQANAHFKAGHLDEASSRYWRAFLLRQAAVNVPKLTEAEQTSE